MDWSEAETRGHVEGLTMQDDADFRPNVEDPMIPGKDQISGAMEANADAVSLNRLLGLHEDEEMLEVEAYENNAYKDEQAIQDRLNGVAEAADAAADEAADESDDPTISEEAITEGKASKRLLPIQVVLSPVLDRDQYEPLEPSWTVQKILGEIDAGDEVWYSVEFEDGRIDQVAFDDIIGLENGRQTHEKRNWDKEFILRKSRMERSSTKRSLPEDDYDNALSSESDVPHKHIEEPQPRRSTRQKSQPMSRQHSFPDEVDSGFDDAFKGMDILGEDPFTTKNKKGLGPNKRTTRSRNSTSQAAPKYVAPAESEDELANDNNSDDDGSFIPITSDIPGAPRGRCSARKRKGRASICKHTNGNESDSIEFESSTRKSDRTSRPTKSMKVPDELDDFEAIDKETLAPKHVSVKEIFPALPEDSEFEQFHSSTCETCQAQANTGKGPLIYCQGCSYSYHKVCLGLRATRDHRVTKIGPNHFVLQCRMCIGNYQKKDANAPNHAMCQTCKLEGQSCAELSSKKTPKQEEKLRQENGGEDPITPVDRKLIDNPDTVLFRCSSCKRGYHFEHLPAMTKNDVNPQDLRAERLEEYSMVDWRCKGCVDSKQKIHALVAWRPVDQEAYVSGQICSDVPEDNKQYLVKWEGRSHFHDTWMPGAWVFGVAAPTMRTSFYKRDMCMLPKMDAKEAIEEEWLLPDVILRVKYKSRGSSKGYTKRQALDRIDDVKEIMVKFQGLSYTEAVWDSPPPRDHAAAWDAFCAAYEEHVNGEYFPTVSDYKMKERIKQYRELDFAEECELKTQPPGLKRGKLMEYQMEGLNWLLYKFHTQDNAVLADEMGLGKTVQVVAFVSALVEDKPNCWPFLIVVPNSTCPNWRRELKQWAPGLRVVTYHGGKAAQDLASRYELWPVGSSQMKAHVVIMSYEAVLDAQNRFRNVKWAGLVVDEGQRLKNEQSLLYKALKDMKIPFRLLLTGTPLQNNKRELFNILQFIDPSQKAEDLDAHYAELNKDNIPELHNLIRPYFLRRTKAQVLKFLPPMAQIILPVSMSVLQEKVSKSIMARNPELIKAIISKSKVKAGERKSLNNILGDLRQVLCHPFVFSDSIEDRSIDDPVKIQQNLVEASGKLVLLNIMLPKLKQRGHRVLIFSQYLHSLTILEDFLTALGLPHSRIDGSQSALEKQKRIDAYNDPDSELFAMLLSTRAGGVGINLATADTVIIYDPDFNPHQDIQALSRAHRIGQKDKVLCFQLMTKDTVEEKIMQIGRKKMALDHALIESLDDEDVGGDDLETILKHGAASLFTDEEKKEKIVFNDASVDKLLDRSQIESTKTDEDASAESTFSFARVWANDSATLNANVDGDDENAGAPVADRSVWENILKLREEEHQRELAAKQKEYGRGARRANDKKYALVGNLHDDLDDELTTQQPQADDDHSGSDPDELYVDGNDAESDKDEEDDDDEFAGSKSSKSRAKAPEDAELGNSNPPLKQPLVVNGDKPVKRKGRPPLSRPPDSSRPPPASMPPQMMNYRQPPPRQTPVPPPVIPLSMTQPRPQMRPQMLANPLNRQPQPQHPRNANPNFVVAIPGVQQPRGSVPQPTRLPIQQPTRPSWNNGVIPQRSPNIPQPPTGYAFNPNQSRVPQSAPTGNGMKQPTNGTVQHNCLICNKPHSRQGACVEMDSIISLRIAIDSLRGRQGDGADMAQATRDYLTKKLRELTSRGPTK